MFEVFKIGDEIMDEIQTERSEGRVAIVVKRIREKLEERKKGNVKEVKEAPTDPVKALDTFVQRLEKLEEPRAEWSGKKIRSQLKRRLEEYKKAKGENPKLTPEEWVGKITGNRSDYTNQTGATMRGGDLVESTGWDLNGLNREDFSKKPGEFKASWTDAHVRELLGEDNNTINTRDERTFNTERSQSFSVGVRGDHGTGSYEQEKSTGYYEEQGITLPKKGEQESGVSVLVQVEKPYREYGIGYAHEGAILGLAFQIPEVTLAKYLQQETLKPPVPSPLKYPGTT